MEVHAEVNVFPVSEQHLSRAVTQFRRAMDRHGLAVKTAIMNTEVAGDSGALFRGLCDAFEQIGRQHDIVLVCKVSNACATAGPHEVKDEILGEIRRMLNGDAETAELHTPPVLSDTSRNLIALAAVIAYRREAGVVEACVREALASGATPESVMQVVAQATQMAELPVERYELAARRAIAAFEAREEEPPP